MTTRSRRRRPGPAGEPSLGRLTPCAVCPHRVTSVRGYLGEDNPVDFYRASVTHEGRVPCHEQIDYSDPDWEVTQLPRADLCAGQLIHFRNMMKVPRHPALALAVAAVKHSKAVFTWPWEFLAHHMPGATEEEVQAAMRQALTPAPWTGDDEG